MCVYCLHCPFVTACKCNRLTQNVVFVTADTASVWLWMYSGWHWTCYLFPQTLSVYDLKCSMLTLNTCDLLPPTLPVCDCKCSQVDTENALCRCCLWVWSKPMTLAPKMKTTTGTGLITPSCPVSFFRWQPPSAAASACMCQPVCLPVSACLSVCVRLSVSACLSVCVSLSVCLCQPVCLSVSACLSVCQSVCISLSACLCQPVGLCLFVSVSVVSLCLCPSLSVRCRSSLFPML